MTAIDPAAESTLPAQAAPRPPSRPAPAGAGPLYQQLAAHYLQAIAAGTLAEGDRMPSVRALMHTHQVSLSTALQVCRHLEGEGWLEARPRLGYFVRRPRRSGLAPASEAAETRPIDAAAYVGIHERVSEIVAKGQRRPVHTNLATTVCAPSLYPAEALARLAAKALRAYPERLVAMPDPRGLPALCQALARRALASGIQARADEVIVAHGCVEALNLALRAVTRPGDTVIVESPTYFGLLQVLESLSLRALEIPTSPHSGISLDALAFVLANEPGVKAVVVMPNLHNPLGSVMPDAHKERLVRLCEQHDLALIEDDIYGDLGPGPGPLRAAKAWDRDGRVIYCHSFNKVLSPGMRVGWMLAGRWDSRVRMLQYAHTRSGDELPQAVVAEFLSSGAFDRHVQRLRIALRRQRERMADAVAAAFPAGTRLSVPAGGMLLWIELPGRLSSAQVFEAALAEGIKIAPGSMFSGSTRFDGFIRLSCGGPVDRPTEAAVHRLGAIVGTLSGR